MWLPPTRGNTGRWYWSGRLWWGGSQHEGVLLTSRGVRAQKSFLSQKPFTPVLAKPPSGLRSPWPSFPSCLQAGSPPRQSRIQACEGSREAGAGSAMETNFDPNCKAPTPYLLFKANPFRRVNITPLFHPALPSCIPGPDLRPLLIAGSTPHISEAQPWAHPPPPIATLETRQSPTRDTTTGATPHPQLCRADNALVPPEPRPTGGSTEVLKWTPGI